MQGDTKFSSRTFVNQLHVVKLYKKSVWSAQWKPQSCFHFSNAEKENKKNTLSLQPNRIKKLFRWQKRELPPSKKVCFCQTDLPLRAERISAALFQMKEKNRSYLDKTGEAWRICLALTHSCLWLTCQPQGNHGAWTLPLFIMSFLPWCSFPEGILWWFEEDWGLLWS